MDEKTVNALLSSITPMSEEAPYAKILIYGDEGTTKTTTAANYGDDILYIDSADGWVTLLDHPQILNKNIRRMPYQGLSQLDAIGDAIEEGHKDFSWIKTVVLDELSSMAMDDLDIVLASRAAKDPNKDPNVPTQPDYLHNTHRVRKTMGRFLKLPVNVIMTAHVREDKDERTGRTYTRPAFTPKMRKTITQQCHIVGHITADMVTVEDKPDELLFVRKMQVRPSLTVVAKSRIKDLPLAVTDPDLNVMLAGWQKRVNKDDETEADFAPEPDGPVTETESSDAEPSINL